MYVERRTYTVKPGCLRELIKLCLDYKKKTGLIFRLYAPEVGPIDQLVIELDYTSLDEYEKSWAEAIKDPIFQEFNATFNALLGGGNKSEIWELIE